MPRVQHNYSTQLTFPVETQICNMCISLLDEQCDTPVETKKRNVSGQQLQEICAIGYEKNNTFLCLDFLFFKPTAEKQQKKQTEKNGLLKQFEKGYGDGVQFCIYPREYVEQQVDKFVQLQKLRRRPRMSTKCQ